MRYWLFKSEPETFSIDDLKARPEQTEHWDGVRNYQVRNLLRDTIKKGDLGFFYHSSCSVPAIVGTVTVVSDGYPDFTSWDKHSPYYDPLSSPENPRWYMVNLKFKAVFKNPVTLKTIKSNPELKEMLLVRKGNRLSITPVSQAEWKLILKLSESPQK